jgi:hypothetical protein
MTSSKGRMSGLNDARKAPQTLPFSLARAGQRDPQQKPGLDSGFGAPDALGEPLTIREVAEIIGCSAWTIRQRYIPDGLPHLRSGPAGKFVFYRHQVVRWILQQQVRQNQTRKGGR